MDRSTVPEYLLPFLEMVSPDSFVATLDIAPDRSYTMRITPVTVDGDGVPMPAEGEAFERIAERLAGLSAELGTVVSAAGDELTIAFGATAAV
jgi:hypothetical protein